jgi:hypothetical protein
MSGYYYKAYPRELDDYDLSEQPVIDDNDIK